MSQDRKNILKLNSNPTKKSQILKIFFNKNRDKDNFSEIVLRQPTPEKPKEESNKNGSDDEKPGSSQANAYDVLSKCQPPKRPKIESKGKSSTRVTKAKVTRSKKSSFSQPNLLDLCKNARFQENFGGIDAEELQLAVALSKSLQDNGSEKADDPDSNPVKSILEDYGFKCKNNQFDIDLANVITKNALPRRGKNKFRPQNLIKTNRAARDKIIADNIEKVLQNNPSYTPSFPTNNHLTILNSSLLQCLKNVEYKIIDVTAFEDPVEETLGFYFVGDLIVPKLVENGYLLRCWSSIPGVDDTEKPRNVEKEYSDILSMLTAQNSGRLRRKIQESEDVETGSARTLKRLKEIESSEDSDTIELKSQDSSSSKTAQQTGMSPNYTISFYGETQEQEKMGLDETSGSVFSKFAEEIKSSPKKSKTKSFEEHEEMEVELNETVIESATSKIVQQTEEFEEVEAAIRAKSEEPETIHILSSEGSEESVNTVNYAHENQDLEDTIVYEHAEVSKKFSASSSDLFADCDDIFDGVGEGDGATKNGDTSKNEIKEKKDESMQVEDDNDSDDSDEIISIKSSDSSSSENILTAVNVHKIDSIPGTPRKNDNGSSEAVKDDFSDMEQDDFESRNLDSKPSESKNFRENSVSPEKNEFVSRKVYFTSTNSTNKDLLPRRISLNSSDCTKKFNSTSGSQITKDFTSKYLAKDDVLPADSRNKSQKFDSLSVSFNNESSSDNFVKDDSLVADYNNDSFPDYGVKDISSIVNNSAAENFDKNDITPVNSIFNDTTLVDPAEFNFFSAESPNKNDSRFISPSKNDSGSKSPSKNSPVSETSIKNDSSFISPSKYEPEPKNSIKYICEPINLDSDDDLESVHFSQNEEVYDIDDFTTNLLENEDKNYQNISLDVIDCLNSSSGVTLSQKFTSNSPDHLNTTNYSQVEQNYQNISLDVADCLNSSSGIFRRLSTRNFDDFNITDLNSESILKKQRERARNSQKNSLDMPSTSKFMDYANTSPNDSECSSPEVSQQQSEKDFPTQIQKYQDSPTQTQNDQDIPTQTQRGAKRKILSHANRFLEKFEVKDQNITPEKDYKKFNSISINQELKKYGIRKLPKKKAIKMLELIYNETHPLIKIVVEDQENSSMVELERKGMLVTEIVHDENFVFQPCLVENEEWVLPKSGRSKKVLGCPLPLHIAFYNLVRSDRVLQNRILEYDNLILADLMSHFKFLNLSYQEDDVISFLDKRCIAYKKDHKSLLTYVKGQYKKQFTRPFKKSKKT